MIDYSGVNSLATFVERPIILTVEQHADKPEWGVHLDESETVTRGELAPDLDKLPLLAPGYRKCKRVYACYMHVHLGDAGYAACRMDILG